MPRRLVLAVLAAAVLLQLAPGLSILGDAPVYGDDHSSHVAAIRQLVALLSRGESDIYCPTFNLGFPMYLYYQPLPHLAAAALSLASFGLLDAQGAFNLLLVLLNCAYPLAIYRGLGAFEAPAGEGADHPGLDPLARLLAAFCAPLVASSLTFGFTTHSVMALGLYTQTWAMVIFPLALGAGWRATAAGAGPRQLLAGAAGLLLLSLCHVFYAVALGTALVVAVLCRPPLRDMVRGLSRLAAMAAVVALTLAYWLIPLFFTRGFAGGWPWGGVDRWQGYGVVRVASQLFSGRLFDLGQLPAITIGLLVGVGVLFWRWRGRPAGRALLCSFLLFLTFLVGRRSLGHLVDVQPLNLGFQLFRYLGVVHLFGVLLAGVGLAALYRLAATRLPSWAAWALLGGLLLSAVVAQQLRAFGLFRTITAYDKATVAELRRFGAALDADAKGSGGAARVYAHNKVGTGTHFIAALQAHYTHQPLGQSYGVGMHDSLGFYYLEYLQAHDEALLDLYGFGWMLVEREGKTGAATAKRLAAAGHQRLARSRHLDLYRRLPSRRHRLWALGHGAFVLEGEPRAVRPAVRSWLSSALPRRLAFGVVSPRRGETLGDAASGAVSEAERDRPRYRMIGATAAMARADAASRWRFRPTREPWQGILAQPTLAAPGRLVSSTSDPRGLWHEASAKMDRPGLLVLKVGYHPFWHVSVDGRPAETLQVTPAFLAVRLPQGAHKATFRFRNPRYQKVLFLLSLSLWLLLGGLWARSRWRQGGDECHRPEP